MAAKTDRWAFRCFIGSFLVAAFVYGVAVGKFRVFPYQVFALAGDGLGELRTRVGLGGPPAWYYRPVHALYPRAFHDPGQAYQGLNLITRLTDDRRVAAEITDMDGNVLHAWDVDWFKVWPDADHLPSAVVPRSRPGSYPHGAVVAEGGDLIYNYDHLGLVRLGRRGGVVWRLPYRTHHSIHQDDDGTLWVCGQKACRVPDPRFKGRDPPYDQYTILQVSPEGEVLREWAVAALLEKNGYKGLLYLGAAEPHVLVRDDRLHLNDVEPFSRTMAGGFFDRDDVLVSLRNVNTVFVFNRRTERIKFLRTGQFVWQHDADFVDGNSLTVFDNNYRDVEGEPNLYSRIVRIDAGRQRAPSVVFRGTPERPFYTPILGKHQWLPNGNLLITESTKGRAFEVNAEGEIVWQYVNYVGQRTIGLLVEVQRLPPAYRPLFGKQPTR